MRRIRMLLSTAALLAAGAGLPGCTSVSPGGPGDDEPTVEQSGGT